MLLLFEFKDIGEYIESIKTFFVGIYDYVNMLLNILPSPFNIIVNTFLAISLILLIIRIIRG